MLEECRGLRNLSGSKVQGAEDVGLFVAVIGIYCCWVVVVVLVIFSTIRLSFPPFNDDLGTMPTRRPYSWKKSHRYILFGHHAGGLLRLAGPQAFLACSMGMLGW